MSTSEKALRRHEASTRPLRILFDFSLAADVIGGPRTVMDGLLSGWSRAASADDRVVYAPESLRPSVEDAGATLVSTRLDVPPRRFVQQQIELPLRLLADRRLQGFDVVLAGNMTCALVPVGPPVVGILHDVRHLRRPEDFSGAANVYRRRMWSASARRMAAAIAVSEFTRQEALQLGLPLPDRVTVIPNGSDHIDAGEHVAREHVVLCIGHRTSKGLDDLPIVWASVAERFGSQAPALHVSGLAADSSAAQELLASFEMRGLAAPRLLGYVATSELHRRMAASRALLYLSPYEGFGLVPTESSSVGTRCFCYDLPPYRERFDELLITTAPLGDPSALGRQLADYLTTDRSESAPMTMPSWTQVASRYRDALVEALVAN